jgi:RNA polymerase sigma-70 factor (ECF subfamily)
VDRDERLRDWVKLYSEKLVRIAGMYVKDQSTAEDRVQNAFIKAYQSMNKLKDVDNPMPWLFRIVVNECKSYMKKNRREVVTSVFSEQNEKSAEEVYLSQPEFSKLHKAVLELQENYKLPIVLYYFEELQVHEIANLLDISNETVRVRLHRGRKRLEKLLEEAETYELGRELANGKAVSL